MTLKRYDCRHDSRKIQKATHFRSRNFTCNESFYSRFNGREPEYQTSALSPLASAERWEARFDTAMEENGAAAAGGGGTGNRVELANLLLPAYDETDLENNHTPSVVLLEARFETCSDLLESTQAPQIQAVIDLDKLSELVGVTRDQFLTDLHQQVSDQLQLNSDHGASASAHEDDDLFLRVDQDDVTSIAAPPSDTATEQTSLLRTSSSGAGSPLHAVSDRVALVADAFIDTLTDVLPDAATTTLDDDSHHDAYFDTMETMENHRALHLQTHAFLLELPQTTTSTAVAGQPPAEESHHFILALPADAQPWDDNVSEASDTSFLQGVSFLPSDVQDVHIEATTVSMPMDYAYNDNIVQYPFSGGIKQPQLPSFPSGIRLDLVVKRQVPLIGYVILITGLWALSSVGVALNWQGHAVSPLLKTYWRLVATALVLLPMAWHSTRASGMPLQQLTSATQWMLLIVCAACYAFMTAAFVVALDLTTVVNAFVLSDLAPLFLILGRWIMGLPVLYTEGLGAAIGFLGGTVCALDQSSSSSMDLNMTGEIVSTSSRQTHPHALTGDLLAFLASAATVIYLLIAKKLRPHVDLFMFMFLLMSIASLFMLAYMILAGEDIRLSDDPNFGLWGWIRLTPDRLPLELYLAVVCNVLGTTGYVAVMKYFEPVVVSTVMLMEPVLGALMGVAAGLDPLPGLQTWIGDGVVTVGIVLVVWSGAKTTETIDATEALLQVGDEDVSGGVGVPLLRSPVVAKSVAHRRKLQVLDRKDSLH
jgi:drug/metabolite transporter (DMT)-like permease